MSVEAAAAEEAVLDQGVASTEDTVSATSVAPDILGEFYVDREFLLSLEGKTRVEALLLKDDMKGMRQNKRYFGREEGVLEANRAIWSVIGDRVLHYVNDYPEPLRRIALDVFRPMLMTFLGLTREEGLQFKKALFYALQKSSPEMLEFDSPQEKRSHTQRVTQFNAAFLRDLGKRDFEDGLFGEASGPRPVEFSAVKRVTAYMRQLVETFLVAIGAAEIDWEDQWMNPSSF